MRMRKPSGVISGYTQHVIQTLRSSTTRGIYTFFSENTLERIIQPKSFLAPKILRKEEERPHVIIDQARASHGRSTLPVPRNSVIVSSYSHELEIS